MRRKLLLLIGCSFVPLLTGVLCAVNTCIHLVGGQLETKGTYFPFPMVKVVCRYDLGMLTDQFDASLVLLRRRFCWDHIDILYEKSRVNSIIYSSY